jgi:hypothetical protein
VKGEKQIEEKMGKYEDDVEFFELTSVIIFHFLFMSLFSCTCDVNPLSDVLQLRVGAGIAQSV